MFWFDNKEVDTGEGDDEDEEGIGEVKSPVPKYSPEGVCGSDCDCVSDCDGVSGSV